MCESRPASSDMCTRSARSAGKCAPGSASRAGCCGPVSCGPVFVPGRVRLAPRPHARSGAHGRGRRDADLLRRLPQLAVHVLPLPHPQVVQVLAAAQAAERRARQLALLVVHVPPQGEEGEEVGPRLGEPRVQRVRGLAGVRGPFPRVLDGQRRRDDQHLGHASLVPGLQDHPAQPRVDRDPGQLPPHAGEPGRAPGRATSRPAPRAAVRRPRCCGRRAGPGTGSPRPRRGRARPPAG